DLRPTARAFFAELSSQNRYAILFRLQDAKRPETRVRRLAKFVAMLEAGENIYPYGRLPPPELTRRRAWVGSRHTTAGALVSCFPKTHMLDASSVRSLSAVRASVRARRSRYSSTVTSAVN